MPYRVAVSPAARRDLKRLPPEVLRCIDARIVALADDPRPPGAVALQGRPGYLRLRVGDYRVIYTVRDETLLVLVVRVGHRREVYRGMR